MAFRRITGRDTSYEFVSHLGQGSFGTVVKLRRTRDGQLMACKTIDCSRHQNMPRFVALEIRTWSSFAQSERYIADFSHDATWTESTQTVRLYMELYEGGDLQSAIARCKHEDRLLHPFMATYWATEIARGMKACHYRGFTHRSIKPSNILLTMPYTFNDMLWALSEGVPLTESQKSLAREFLAWFDNRHPWCQITDFGFGKFTEEAWHPEQCTLASFPGGLSGTPGPRAPETIGNSIGFTNKSDVYSFGCLLYSLCSSISAPNIESPDIPALIRMLSNDYPKRLVNIISRCLDQNPVNRPNSREITDELSEAQLDLSCSQKFGSMRIKLANAISANNEDDDMGEATGFDSDIDNAGRSPETLGPAVELDQEYRNNKLRDALFHANTDNMRAAIAAGGNVNISADTQIQPRSEFNNPGFFPMLLRARELSQKGAFKVSLLTFAVEMHLPSCVRILLENNAHYDVNDQSSNPLMIAAKNNDHEIVSLLVENWDFNVDQQSVNSEVSVLSIAASTGSKDVVARLLGLKAKPFIATKDGDTVIHILAMLEKDRRLADSKATMIESCCNLILDSAPYLVNMRNTECNTPLHSAFLAGARSSFIQLLITRGAIVYYRNMESKNVLDILNESPIYQDKDLIRQILRSGTQKAYAIGDYCLSRDEVFPYCKGTKDGIWIANLASYLRR
ncbi:Serine/threonine-protein kinase Nek2 [Orbilia ellipsospora]|uniref:non-specific serine/threonine protein kinase n=1 Tax=Orbilia ellipsospora TaxID=2528407 RepID=A0AAV9XQR4_9PEZI